MKNIILLIKVTLISLLLISCGEKKTSEGDPNNTVTTSGTKVVIINCDGSGAGVKDCSTNHTCVKSGDSIVSENNSTLLEIITLSDGTKKVCIKTTTPVGVAHILR